MLSHYQMKEIPYLRILGRTNGSLEPVTLFWTASGIELNVKATEIWVKIRSDYDVFEPWVDVIVDGVWSQRLMVNKGEQKICLFRNMERDKVRNVKLLRDTLRFLQMKKHCFSCWRLKLTVSSYLLKHQNSDWK